MAAGAVNAATADGIDAAAVDEATVDAAPVDTAGASTLDAAPVDEALIIDAAPIDAVVEAATNKNMVRMPFFNCLIVLLVIRLFPHIDSYFIHPQVHGYQWKRGVL